MGSQQAAEAGAYVCLLKGDRLPLRPKEQQLFGDLQVEGQGVTGIDNLVEKRFLAKDPWLLPAEVLPNFWKMQPSPLPLSDN